MASLREYTRRRHFKETPEPRAKKGRSSSRRLFVVQKHRATQLHYDFRLEDDGTLKSWAIPKGPSLDPSAKRLAMAVEDHPIEYAGFEGVIPEGEYGAGTVMVWDAGTYEPRGTNDVSAALRRGELKFALRGKKLKGLWVLVRTRNRQWLLIKHRDRYASAEDVTNAKPRSVLSRRLLAQIAKEGGGDVAKAATGDPRSRATAPTRPRRRPSK